jgi:tetratricopeptide (TPR) repeat protein
MPFTDFYLPALLESPLYYADGQQRDEVFVWGSFLQSRMHAAGVTCGDCHDPHTQKLRAPGNAVCAQCHLASKYDATSHHFHPGGSRGAQCANCHMPATTYMVIDPRRDHSLRVPRPDLSVKLGTPNACNECHRDNTAQWAADRVAGWYGAQRRNEPHYGEALDAGRRAQPGAARALVAIATSVGYPPIVRATAIELLARYPGIAADDTTAGALLDADPLVRRTAVMALRAAGAQQLAARLAPLLDDPVRAVRIEAARRLVPVATQLDPARKPAFERALAEYEAVQKTHLDRPESWLNLGNLAAARADAAGAETAYREALKRDPRFVPAHVNLADLKREQQRETEAEAILRAALKAHPNAPALHEALGLALVRQGRKAEALREFAAASKSAPGEPRYAYLHAVALHDAGRVAEALRVLADAAVKSGDRDVLLALATYRSQGGDESGAAAALRALAAVNPDDPAVRRR